MSLDYKCCVRIDHRYYDSVGTGEWNFLVLQGITFREITKQFDRYSDILLLCCRSLLDVPIPGTVRTIQRFAFDNCGALIAVDLPESVIAIAGEAYRGCSLLVSVTIRSSTNAVQVGKNVFRGCPSLSTIKVYPWHFPKIFAAMTDDPSFLYKFFHQYHHQIVDEEAEVGMVTRQHRNGRRRRRQRPPQKKQRIQG